MCRLTSTTITDNTPPSAARPHVSDQRKLAEGKTKKEAMRALKRRISDAVYRQLLADTRD